MISAIRDEDIIKAIGRNSTTVMETRAAAGKFTAKLTEALSGRFHEPILSRSFMFAVAIR